MSTLKEVADKLDTLIRLTALALFSDAEMTQKEKIKRLATTGLAVRDIADILGTTPNTVNVTLSRSRMRKKKKTDRKASSGDSQ